MARRKFTADKSGLSDTEIHFLSRHTAGVDFTREQEFAVRRFAYENPDVSVAKFVETVRRNHAEFGAGNPVDLGEEDIADIYQDVHDHPDTHDEERQLVIDFLNENLEAIEAGAHGEDLRQYIRENYLDFGFDGPDDISESEFWELFRAVYEDGQT